jgi:hypothetical protein
MIRLTSVVLPAPVGPTMATVCPAAATSERPSISGRSGSYRNETDSKTTSPRRRPSASIADRGTGSSSASSSSNTRSADATPDCSRLTIDASWVRGWLNWREYWMNACTLPRLSEPLATRSPPRTAIAT